jgi:hypothetical protein
MGVPILQKVMRFVLKTLTDRQLHLVKLASSFRVLFAFSIKKFSQDDVTVNTVSSAKAVISLPGI